MNNVLRMIKEYQGLYPVREVTTEYTTVQDNVRSTQIKIVEGFREHDGTYTRSSRVLEPHREVSI